MAEPGEILPDRKIDTSAYDLLQTTKTSVEDIVAQMLFIKKEGGGGSDSTKSQLPELVTQMLLNFVNLRKVPYFYPICTYSYLFVLCALIRQRLWEKMKI